MSKFHFTKAAVIAAPIGTHYDTRQSGLCVTVTEHSRKYGIYISVKNKPVRRSLGDVADKSVEAVRAEAARVIAELRESPKVKAKKATVGEVLKLYTAYLYDEKAKDPEYMTDVMDRYWADLLPRQLDGITVLELTQAYRRIVKDRGPSAGRYAINCLRTVFNFADSLELTSNNPARKVKTSSAVSREVFLTDAEVKVMRACLAEMSPNPRHFFTLALLTGLRRDNLSRLRWEWVDLDEEIITVPAAESKNGREIVVPLVAEAVEILKGRRALDPVYVFPSNYRSGQPVTAIDGWIIDLRRRMRERGVEKYFVLHDLRRTRAVQLTAAGAPLPIVAKMLGHISLRSTPIYARASVDTVRDWLGKVA